MSDPILFAIPAFVILLIVEVLWFRYLPDDAEAGYERRDTFTSLSMGFGYLGVAVFWKLAPLAIYSALGRDIRSAPRVRDAFGYAVQGPGWTPAPAPVTGPAPGAAPA